VLRAIARAYRSAYTGLPRDLWVLSAILVVNRAGSMVLPFLSLYFTQVRGMPIAQAGRRLSLIGLGAFLVCVGLAAMSLGRSLPFVALTIALWTFGEMLSLPLINAVVADRAAPGTRGRYMGIYTMAFSLAFMFAPAFGTFVYQGFGPDKLWYGIGGLGVVLWLWALALRRPLRVANSVKSP